MIRLKLSTVALTMLAAAGCGAGSDQEVTGTINRSSFPEAVTHARAVGTLTTVEAPIAADGTFTLTLPEHDRYRIELVSATRQSDLVFPRGAGLVDTSFYVEAARDDLALGAIRYIGDVGNAAHEGDGGDTGSGGGEEGGGSTCGGDVDEATGQSETGEAAVPETNPPAAIGCDDTEGGEEGGGSGDTGTGGSEEGGGSEGGGSTGGSEEGGGSGDTGSGGSEEGGGSEGGGSTGGSEGGGSTGGSEGGGSGGGSEGGGSSGGSEGG